MPYFKSWHCLYNRLLCTARTYVVGVRYTFIVQSESEAFIWRYNKKIVQRDQSQSLYNL